MADRELLHDQLCRHLASLGDMGRGALSSLRKMPVYEVSNAAAMFDQIDFDGSDRSISRKPPHDLMWIEWVKGDGEGLTQFGFTVRTASPEQMAIIRDNCAASGIVSSDIEEATEFYTVTPFFKCLRLSSEGIRLGANPDNIGRLVSSHLKCTLIARDNASWVSNKTLNTEADGIHGLFRGDIIKPETTWRCIWPAFMSFALLHCRNVSTELVEPREQTPERLVKRGVPKKRYYRVLRLELPNEIRPHAPTTEEAASEKKMRFHLCRGHFKNLQAERYKNKGWHWWPAHWKGSKSIGRVDKHYELTPRKEPEAVQQQPTP